MSDFIQVFAGRPQSSRVLYVGMSLQEAQALDVAVYINMEICLAIYLVIFMEAALMSIFFSG